MSVRQKRTNWRTGIRDGFTSTGDVKCEGCFQKKLELVELREEVTRLKAKVRRLEKLEMLKKEGMGGAHIPSSRIPYKAKAEKENVEKRGGARMGHKGHGRKRLSDPSHRVEVELPGCCAQCGCELKRDGKRERSVLDSIETKVQEIIYEYARGKCPKCMKVHSGRAPLLPRFLYGNALLSKMTVMHYVHGIPLGRICEMLGRDKIKIGGIIAAFHRLASLCAPLTELLINDYRRSTVRHADETGWRTDGQSGYAWLFSSSSVSIFEHRNTRSSRVALEILGQNTIPGVLVVDRYAGYNKVPCKIQYCYAHLLREIEKLEDDFPDEPEITTFVSILAPLFAAAMRLGTQEIARSEFSQKANEIKRSIKTEAQKNYKHLGIKHIQQILRKNASRLYHWVSSPKIPSHNNRAERELRQVVISRKVSFGSQSEAGARTRSVLMSVLLTAKKRLKEQSVEEWFKNLLDNLTLYPNSQIISLMPQAP